MKTFADIDTVNLTFEQALINLRDVGCLQVINIDGDGHAIEDEIVMCSDIDTDAIHWDSHWSIGLSDAKFNIYNLGFSDPDTGYKLYYLVM